MERPEPARKTDAREVLALYRAAAAQARRAGHTHWDENYPSEETVRKDLEGGWLYVWREDGRIVAAITLTPAEEMEAEGVEWTSARRAAEACRFCLSPALQGKGRAKAYFLGAVDLLRAQGVDALRYTCAKENVAAYRIYTGIGHRIVGETTWHGTEFYAFEALL